MESDDLFQHTRNMKPQMARKSMHVARKSQQEDMDTFAAAVPSNTEAVEEQEDTAKPEKGKAKPLPEDVIDLCDSEDEEGGKETPTPAAAAGNTKDMDSLPFVSVENLLSNFPNVKHCEFDFHRLVETSMQKDPVEFAIKSAENELGGPYFYCIAHSKRNPEKVYRMQQSNRFHYSILQKGLLPKGNKDCEFLYQHKTSANQALAWWITCEHGDVALWLTECLPEGQWESLEGDSLDTKFLMLGGTKSNPFCTLMRYNQCVFGRHDEQQRYISRSAEASEVFQLLSHDPYKNLKTVKTSDTEDSDSKPIATSRTRRKRAPTTFLNLGCTCEGCERKEDCGICDICTKKVASGSSSMCLARRCVAQQSKRQKSDQTGNGGGGGGSKKSIDAMAWPSIGGRVYARWENSQWYWGNVTAINEARRCFRVEFDDGDVRDDVPFEELVTKELKDHDEAEAERKSKEQRKKKEEEKAKKMEELRKLEEEKKRIEAERRRAEELRQLDNVEIGDRCYARYKDGKWYRGKITSIFGNGPAMKCSVKFDDGDVRNNCSRKTDLKTVDEFIRAGLCCPNFAELQKLRCGTCFFCKKEDCGKCRSCVSNKISTAIMKDCCMHKVCSKLEVDFHAQNIPRFPNGWVYFSGWPSNKKTECPELQHFRFVNQNTEPRTIYYGIKNAGLAAGVHEEDSLFAQREISNALGLRVRESKDHFLVNKGFCQVWQTRNGAFNILFGHVKKCESEFGQEIFTIQYNQVSLDEISGPGCRKVPDVVEMSNEAEVWGGCLLYEVKTDFHSGNDVHKMRDEKVVEVQHWLNADQFRYDLVNGAPRKIMNFRGWKLEFEARTSLIPDAGLGVFMRATPARPGISKTFKLEEGELLDIGIYGPLTECDTKSNTLNLFKDFIHSGKCESWSFEPPDHHKTDFTFDITDNETGDLHEVAQKNIPSFVNETDGRLEIPSITACHDPQNAVHYLLGHSFNDGKKKGHFALARDEWIELKIDYGPDYERVRVKKGYSRLGEEDRMKMENDIRNDVSEKLRDILYWSVNDCEECVQFVESTNEPVRPPQKKEEKILIALLCFYSRCIMVKRDFSNVDPNRLPPDACDGGFSKMKEKKLIPRMRDLIKKFLDLWDDERLKSVILGEEVAVFFLCKLMHKEASYLKGLLPATLRHEVEFKVGLLSEHARVIE